MPIALVSLLIDILLVYHAARTGRLVPWAFIIIMVPILGPIIYFAVEIVPELLGGPGAARTRRQIASKLNPERRYRELHDRLYESDTIANRAALAAECLTLGRFDEAQQLYAQVLEMPLGQDPNFAFGKATAEFESGQAEAALRTLDDLQVRWPQFTSPQAHLLYAKSLAESGRPDEALSEYHALAGYFPGIEAKVRYSQLLSRMGRSAEARDICADVLRRMQKSPKYVRRAEANWISAAEEVLSR